MTWRYVAGLAHVRAAVSLLRRCDNVTLLACNDVVNCCVCDVTGGQVWREADFMSDCDVGDVVAVVVDVTRCVCGSSCNELRFTVTTLSCECFRCVPGPVFES